MRRRPTLKDVVAATGLSIFTVSRALNGAEGVSEASRKKVLAAAKAIGYVPNDTARAVRKQTSGPVIVMTASISNTYYIDMISGIYSGLQSDGLSMRTADLAPEGIFDAALELAAIEEAMRSRAAGVISTLTLGAENYRKLTGWGVPVVFVDSYPPELDLTTASVTTDNVQATADIGAHLAGHGLLDWVLVIYPALWSTRIAREQGLRMAAERHGATLTVIECANDSRAAEAATTAYIADRTESGPIALIAGNNPLLRGALTATRSASLRLPQDVCLISFDEFMWSELLDPPVTVVDEDSKGIGELAATTLRRIIQRNSTRQGPEPGSGIQYLPEDTSEVKANLVIRQSCGCA